MKKKDEEYLESYKASYLEHYQKPDKMYYPDLLNASRKSIKKILRLMKELQDLSYSLHSKFVSSYLTD